MQFQSIWSTSFSKFSGEHAPDPPPLAGQKFRPAAVRHREIFVFSLEATHILGWTAPGYGCCSYPFPPPPLQKEQLKRPCLRALNIRRQILSPGTRMMLLFVVGCEKLSCDEPRSSEVKVQRRIELIFAPKNLILMHIHLHLLAR